MRELLKKYHRYGRPAGTVRLDDATQEECAAARGIFGRPFSPPLRFQTAQFEAALQELRFGKISLKEVLESYFDIEIKTKNELRELESNRFSAMLTQVLEQTDNSSCVRWLQTLSNSQGGGYQLLRREAVKDLDGTRRSLLQACRSLDWLERHTQGAVRLAVLSAQSTSDPHAPDSGTLAESCFCTYYPFVPTWRFRKTRNSGTSCTMKTASYVTAFPALSLRQALFFTQEKRNTLRTNCSDKVTRYVPYPLPISPD